MVEFFVEILNNRSGEDSLIKSIEKSGHKLTIVKNLPFSIGAQIDCKYVSSSDILPDDKPCVFIGSLGLSKKLKHVGSNYTTYRGNWCNLPKYDCHRYYPHLTGNLLNNHYVMLPFGSLWNQWCSLQDYFASQSLFVRPNTGDKLFTGMVVRGIDEIRKIECTAKIDDLVVISSPKQLEYEVRIVVIDGVAVTGSVYRQNGLFYEYLGMNEELKQFAEYIAKLYQPDRAFVVDCCYLDSHDQTPRVVEINSFSCSGFYKCDTDKIVSHIAALAVDEFEQEK